MDPTTTFERRASSGSVKNAELTTAQVAVRTDRYFKQIIIGILLMFCFVDVLGQALFMPAGPILCQQAEGGPVQTYAQLLLTAPGALDFGELGLKKSFTDLFDSLDDRAAELGKCPPDVDRTINGNIGCRNGLTESDTRQMAVDVLGNPRAFQDIPMKYSTATNFLVMLGSVTSGLGQALWGWASDKIGRKPCMIICQIGGLGSYALMYLAGSKWNDYWSFSGGLVLNGLFSGSFTIVNAYFLDIMSRKEAEGPNNLVMGMSILGGAVGSLILMPFVSGRGERLFDSCWVAIGCSCMVFVATIFVVPESKKSGFSEATADRSTGQLIVSKKGPNPGSENLNPVESGDLESGELADGAGRHGLGTTGPEHSNSQIGFVSTMSNESSPPPHINKAAVEEQSNMGSREGSYSSGAASSSVTIVASRILWVTVIGGALDAAGDEGTRIARGTILQNVWPTTNDLMFQNILLLSLIGMLFLVLALVEIGKTTIGLGATTVLGAAMTLVTQLLLNAKIIKWETYPAFLGIWYGGKLFGMCSSFGSFAIVNEFAPQEAVGTWSGFLQGLSGVAEAVATMSIAILYDAMNDGSDDGLRGVVAMFLTAGISVLAVICYSPLIVLVPAKAPDNKVQAKRFLTVEQYEQLTDLEYKRLTMEEIDFQETRRMQDGKIPRVMIWGSYLEEIPELEGMMERALKDFEFMKRYTTSILTSQAKLEEDRQYMKQMDHLLEGTVDIEDQRRMMGEWVTRYLEDAGYHTWWQFPQFFKVMLMNTFPPVKALDGKRTDWDTCDYEEMSLNFLKVADQHVRQRRSNNWTGLPRSLRMAKSAV